MHCNPNALENLDHLSTNVSEQDDRSKWVTDKIFTLYWSHTYKDLKLYSIDLLKPASKQSRKEYQVSLPNEHSVFQILASQFFISINK